MTTKLYVALMAISLFTACSNKEEVTVPTEFKADEETSALEWKGSAPDHFHIGAFKVSGNLQTNGSGKITGGDFTIPIASISNFDLTDAAIREQLLNHLKSPDFFNVAVHPNATFHITKVEPYSNTASSANTIISGDFTMIGQTHSIQIPAVIKTENNKISAEGSFKLNRLQWGMNSFNDPEAELYILPDVDITLKLNFKS
ncbi:YceI-like domain-containing protein [Chitinophaga costaii]|uniref:YceI-like domain-containing protein n=1 Tax=Chitinophaga costaii TaxID=1335309 RepID=A0A1C4BAE9_9BACT|nr:YceI family protein [Chitinophaga costaii]PUZ27689.1 YceI family protein [Chitinophaga costaii]SCC03764.1 YceI-like domain-containing protein [Chitinophaga costaii]